MPKAKSTEKIPGLQVTVRGQYYAAVDKGKALKIFKDEIFYLPLRMVIQTGFRKIKKEIEGRTVQRAIPFKQNVPTREWVMHIIQRICLPSRLREKLDDFHSVRTCTIENIKEVAAIPRVEFGDLEGKNIMKMTLSELHRFCQLEGLQVPIDSFSSADDAREAVQTEFDSSEKLKAKEQDIPQTAYAETEKQGKDGMEETHLMDPGLTGDPANPEEGGQPAHSEAESADMLG